MHGWKDDGIHLKQYGFIFARIANDHNHLDNHSDAPEYVASFVPYDACSVECHNPIVNMDGIIQKPI
jgi:hypothetical protein